jgi:predicted enzyme related to lactoylglutathione lyase
MQSKAIIWAGLYVEDLAAQVAFYRDVLQLPLRRQGIDWAHFDAGGGVLLELMTGGVASHAPKGSQQQSLVIAFLVDDLDETVAELKRRGVTFLGEPEGYKNQRWAHFCDPEGNRLEIKEIRRPA